MSKTELQRLREIFKKYNLGDNDYFTQTSRTGKKQYTIITRPGIEKIQYQSGITIRYEMCDCSPEFAVVKATGTKDGKFFIETFGGASNQKNNCTSSYYPEMAEKRAMARCVLKLENLYEYGVFSEDEQIKNEDIEKEMMTNGQINRIESLLNNTSLDSETIFEIEEELQNVNQSFKWASGMIQYLEQHQVNAIESGNNYGAKEINSRLDEIEHDNRK